MSINNVKEYFKEFGIADRIQEFTDSSATVELAAKALGCDFKMIAKSLAFDVFGKGILIVAAGDAKVDNSKFKEKFKVKANMIKPENVEKIIGHKVGSVCPFALSSEVKVYLDISLKRFNEIYPACGSSNSAIKLTIDELEKYSNYISWVDVCKNWQNIIE